MAHYKKITKARQAKFCEYLARTANVTKACEAINVSRVQVYHERRRNEEFAEAWDAAREAGLDALEEEARRRALDGVTEDVYYQGTVVGQKINYSDTLLMFLLNGGRPEVYRNRHEVTGAGGEPLMQGVVQMPMAVNSEDWAEFAAQQQANLKQGATDNSDA